MTDPGGHVTPELLEAGLADLGRSLAYPVAGDDLAGRVAARLHGRPAAAASWRERLGLGPSSRPLARALLVAMALLLVLAAVAAAVGLGLPGLRIVFGEPGATAQPARTAGASVAARPGQGLGLGVETSLEAAALDLGWDPLVPAELGPPETAWVLNRRLTLVWPSSNRLPELPHPGVGLVLTQFRGHVDEAFYRKQVEAGVTQVEEVTVSGGHGYWLTGEPHVLVYVDEQGRAVEETRRIVGDVLIWRRGELTLRLETALDRDATIALAESLR